MDNALAIIVMVLMLVLFAMGQPVAFAMFTMGIIGLLALLGGLLVVEGIFGVNGLGETLRDLVVDRQGPDPLLLCGVLLVFSLAVTLVELAPIERAVARWRT